MEREETLTVNNSEYRNVDVTYWLSLSTEHPTQPSIQLVDHYTDSVDGDMGATRNAECDTVHHHDHHHISLSYQPSSPSSASPISQHATMASSTQSLPRRPTEP